MGSHGHGMQMIFLRTVFATGGYGSLKGCMRIIFGLMEDLQPIYLYQIKLLALLVLLKHVGRNSVLQVFSEILELLGCLHNAFIPCICYLSQL